MDPREEGNGVHQEGYVRIPKLSYAPEGEELEWLFRLNFLKIFRRNNPNIAVRVPATPFQLG